MRAQSAYFRAAKDRVIENGRVHDFFCGRTHARLHHQQQQTNQPSGQRSGRPRFDGTRENTWERVVLFWQPPSVFSQWTPSRFAVEDDTQKARPGGAWVRPASVGPAQAGHRYAGKLRKVHAERDDGAAPPGHRGETIGGGEPARSGVGHRAARGQSRSERSDLVARAEPFRPDPAKCADANHCGDGWRCFFFFFSFFSLSSSSFRSLDGIGYFSFGE